MTPLWRATGRRFWVPFNRSKTDWRSCAFSQKRRRSQAGQLKPHNGPSRYPPSNIVEGSRTIYRSSPHKPARFRINGQQLKFSHGAGLRAYPVALDDDFVGLVSIQAPHVYQGLTLAGSGFDSELTDFLLDLVEHTIGVGPVEVVLCGARAEFVRACEGGQRSGQAVEATRGQLAGRDSFLLFDPIPLRDDSARCRHAFASGARQSVTLNEHVGVSSDELLVDFAQRVPHR